MTSYDGPERRVNDPGEMLSHVVKADRTLRILAFVLGVVLFIAFALTSYLTWVTNERVIQIQEQQQEQVEGHRVRNELLHRCIVDLVFAIISTPREERADIPNPCPDENEPVEIPDPSDQVEKFFD